MFEELGISLGTAIMILIALYFIIKWAVRNGIKEAFEDITGEETFETKQIQEYMANHQIVDDNEETDKETCLDA